ncbi:MAG: hypothetical protein GY720_17515 [bacterium]|nr:hypothetical protein [bacterium]
MNRVVWVAAVVVLVGACSAGDNPVADVFGDGSGERLVLVVDVEWGLTQTDYILAFPPKYSIYADGSMYFLDPTPPDPPFNPLLRATGTANRSGSGLAVAPIPRLSVRQP